MASSIHSDVKSPKTIELQHILEVLLTGYLSRLEQHPDVARLWV